MKKMKKTTLKKVPTTIIHYGHLHKQNISKKKNLDLFIH